MPTFTVFNEERIAECEKHLLALVRSMLRIADMSRSGVFRQVDDRLGGVRHLWRDVSGIPTCCQKNVVDRGGDSGETQSPVR